jgi:hypothetical protein
MDRIHTAEVGGSSSLARTYHVGPSRPGCPRTTILTQRGNRDLRLDGSDDLLPLRFALGVVDGARRFESIELCQRPGICRTCSKQMRTLGNRGQPELWLLKA